VKETKQPEPPAPSNSHHSKATPPWPSEAIDIGLIIVLISIIYLITHAILVAAHVKLPEPKEDFIDYYVFTGAECVGMWLLNRKYPLKLLSTAGLGKACRYGFGVGLIFVGIYLCAYLGGALGRIVPNDYSRFVTYGLFDKSVYLLNYIVLGPIVEEVVFRGFFYRMLKIRYDIFWAGLISIFMFSAVHGSDPAMLMGGFIFTYTYEKSGTVWGSIIAHAMCNLLYHVFLYLI
jgi:membrane protease YdiL (CAAX protease family)